MFEQHKVSIFILHHVTAKKWLLDCYYSSRLSFFSFSFFHRTPQDFSQQNEKARFTEWWKQNEKRNSMSGPKISAEKNVLTLLRKGAADEECWRRNLVPTWNRDNMVCEFKWLGRDVWFLQRSARIQMYKTWIHWLEEMATDIFKNSLYSSDNFQSMV